MFSIVAALTFTAANSAQGFPFLHMFTNSLHRQKPENNICPGHHTLGQPCLSSLGVPSSGSKMRPPCCWPDPSNQQILALVHWQGWSSPLLAWPTNVTKIIETWEIPSRAPKLTCSQKTNYNLLPREARSAGETLLPLMPDFPCPVFTATPSQFSDVTIFQAMFWFHKSFTHKKWIHSFTL